MFLENDNIEVIEENVEPVEDNSAEINDADTVEDNSTPDDGQVDVETNEENETQSPTQEQSLILGKFKTQEDLIKAYTNLQSQFTRLNQQSKAQPPQKAAEQPQVDDETKKDNEMAAWYEQEVQTNPVRANAVLAQYMAQKEINAFKKQFETQLNPIIKEREDKKAFDNFLKRFPDAEQYNDAMQEEFDIIAQEDPELLDSPKVYETAYYRAKLKSLESNAKTAFENGRKQAAKTASEKKKINNEIKNSKESELPAGVNIIEDGDRFFL